MIFPIRIAQVSWPRPHVETAWEVFLAATFWDGTVVPVLLMAPCVAPMFDHEAVLRALGDAEHVGTPLHLPRLVMPRKTLEHHLDLVSPLTVSERRVPPVGAEPCALSGDLPGPIDVAAALEFGDRTAEAMAARLPRRRAPEFATTMVSLREEYPWAFLHGKLLGALRRRFRPGESVDDLALAERALSVDAERKPSRGRPRGQVADPQHELALYDIARVLGAQSESKVSAGKLTARVLSTGGVVQDDFKTRHALQRERQRLREHRIAQVGVAFPTEPLPLPSEARQKAVQALADAGFVRPLDALVQAGLLDWACGPTFLRRIRVVSHGGNLRFTIPDFAAPPETPNQMRVPLWLTPAGEP